MKFERIKQLGMDLDCASHKSCTAYFGIGRGWATLYGIQSLEPGKGHATELLTAAKAHYDGLGLTFGGTVSLNPRMRRLYERLGITEYEE